MTTTSLTRLYSIQTDVVTTTTGGVSQLQMDSKLASGTLESIGQCLGSIILARRGWDRVWLLSSPLVLWLLVRIHATSCVTRVSSPDTDSLLLRVVETLGALGLAAHTIETRVEDITFIGQLTWINSVLPGTVSISWNRKIFQFFVIIKYYFRLWTKKTVSWCWRGRFKEEREGSKVIKITTELVETIFPQCWWSSVQSVTKGEISTTSKFKSFIQSQDQGKKWPCFNHVFPSGFEEIQTIILPRNETNSCDSAETDLEVEAEGQHSCSFCFIINLLLFELVFCI